MSAPGPYNPNPQPSRSGGGGLSVLMIILIIGGVLLLACAGICGGCLYVGRNAAQSGMAWAELLPTMDRASTEVINDPQVIEKLGEGVTISEIPARDGSGELKAGGEDFHFGVTGPNGTATVQCSAFQDSGSWKITVISVRFSDGTTLNVPPPAAGSDVEFNMPEMPGEATAPSDEK